MTISLVHGLSRKVPAVLGMLAMVLALDSGLALGQAESKTKSSAADAKVKAKTTEKDAQKKTKAIDLNHASAEKMIEELPGVGEATAKKIIDGRPYTSVDDLLKVGIPKRVIDGIRTDVFVKAAAEPKEKPKESAKKKEAAEPKKEAMPVEESAKKKEASKAKAEMPKEATAKTEVPKVDLNTGKLEQLQTLPGIGEVTAKAIVAARPFTKVDDLEKVKGLGKAKIEGLRNLVVVAPPVVKEPVAKAETKTAEATAKPAMTKKSSTTTTEKAAVNPIKPGEVVNINTAEKDVLDRLPGIGPIKAQAILDARPFKTKEDIMKVKGIKEGEFNKIKDMIKVD